MSDLSAPCPLDTFPLGKYRVDLRKGKGWQIKPNAYQTDGEVYKFFPGWFITKEDSSLYDSEVAMVPIDRSYPLSAPGWIASGDLSPVDTY